MQTFKNKAEAVKFARIIAPNSKFPVMVLAEEANYLVIDGWDYAHGDYTESQVVYPR